MNTQSLSLVVSASIGSVSAQYVAPEKIHCIMTLAHGAGAGMNHPFMTTLAKSLAETGIGSLRFNFPFVEHKKGRPDVPAVAYKTIEAAIERASALLPSGPLFVSGKSFGGRMTSQYLSINHHAAVKGIIFYGFPLHQIGKPSVERAAHLKDVKVPMLFLQGTRDAMANLGSIESVCSSLPRAVLVKIEGADHSFKAGKQDIVPMLAKATSDWIKGLTGN